MLRHVDPRATPQLLYTLACMGHGDTIALVDSNFPAHSIADGKPVIELAGLNAPCAAELLLKLMPIDSLADSPCVHMQVSGDPGRVEPVHQEVQRVIDTEVGCGLRLQGIERFEFYARAARTFTMVRSTEPRLYGCFIFTVGAVAPEADALLSEIPG
jgi:L-fucose mutarotase